MKKGECFLGALTAGLIAFQLSCGEGVNPPLKITPTPRLQQKQKPFEDFSKNFSAM